MAWTYEQNFETLSVAALNGQDSWSGDATYYNVSSTTPIAGTKDLAVTTPASGSAFSISRSLTAMTAGTFYISINKGDAGGSDKRPRVELYEGASQRTYMWIPTIASIVFRHLNSSNVYSSLSATTTYRWGYDFDNSTDTIRYSKDNSAWSTTYAYASAATNIDKIQFTIDDNNSKSSGATRIDDISASYVTVVGPANLKTFNGLAKASVKQIGGLALASVKSVNGLT